MRSVLLLLSIVLLSSCKKNTTTPSGAEVLRWDKSLATRASVPGAKELGPRVSKDVKIVVHPDKKGPVTLKVHVETAPLEIVEDGKTYRHTSPLVVRATVDANDDWTVTGKCQGGPDYPMGPVGANGSMISPEAMVLQCALPMHCADATNDLSTSVAVEIKGDGSVAASMAFGKATVE